MKKKGIIVFIFVTMLLYACGTSPEKLFTEETQRIQTRVAEDWATQTALAPTPEPTATPTQKLPDFYNLLSPVVNGEGVPDGSDYDPGSSGFHRLVILNSDGSAHEWNREVRLEWLPDTLSEIDLVIVLSQEEESAIESRSYSGDVEITRYRFSIPVEIREASTGDLLWRSIIFGSEPKEFEWTIVYNEDNPPSRYEGEHVGYSDFDAWMHCKINPQSCIMINISTQIREQDGMEMVFVPAGEFAMGSDDGSESEKPVHIVELDGFWIDQTEVTSGMYAQCVDAGACSPQEESNPTQVDTARYDVYPVINVSWFQANDYCNWIGGRLPTEAEWEKAARGDDGRLYPWGDDEPTCRLANYWTCVNRISAVGSYPAGASPYGALDMAGNVWEWTADWYAEDYYSLSSSKNPLGAETGELRVLKGDSWWGSNPYIGSMSSRFPAYPDEGSDDYGFRCVISE